MGQDTVKLTCLASLYDTVQKSSSGQKLNMWLKRFVNIFCVFLLTQECDQS